MDKRKIAVVCGVTGAIAGVVLGVAEVIKKKRQKDLEKYPWNKPGRVWEA
jgi:hypothetical protein